MADHLEVRASTKEYSRYRKLVDADWNKVTLESLLALLWDVVRDSASKLDKRRDWLRGFMEAGAKRHAPMPADVVERLKLLGSIFRGPHIPQMPNDLRPGNSRLAAQTETSVVYLLLQVICHITGETGFFRDLQSLLFLNSIRYLLPKLKNSSKDEHALLVNALQIHAFVEWRDDPSHMFFLLGAMMGQMGDKKARASYLYRALSTTPIDDHSYLTKANAYWAELLELGERDEAMNFLLKLSRNVPQSYADEISEMIKETAQFQQAT